VSVVALAWNMLMDCLAEGRSVFLPAASAVSGVKMAVNAIGAYARLRKQFRGVYSNVGSGARKFDVGKS